MLFPEFLSLFPFVLCIPLFIVNLFITFRGTKIFDSATKISYILLLRTDSGTIVSPFVESKLWGYPLGFSSEIVLKSFPLHGCSASSANKLTFFSQFFCRLLCMTFLI